MRLNVAGHLDETGDGRLPEERPQDERSSAPEPVTPANSDQKGQDQPSETMPSRDHQPGIGGTSEKGCGRDSGLLAQGGSFLPRPVRR